jgi:hypothetical protein
MNNNNILYVALGLGAGILAYFILCKNKVKNEEVEQIQETEEKPNRLGNMPVTTFAKPKYFTPVATTTPLVVNVTTTKPATTTTSPTTTTTSTVASAPVTTTSTVKPTTETAVAPTTTTTSTLKPLTETVSTATMTSAPTVKLAFDGVGQHCFEVGDCLHDL